MKITYEDKVSVIPRQARVNQVQDLDLNEIKEVVNSNYDEMLTAIDSQITDSKALSNPNIAVPAEITGNVHILGVEPGTYPFWGGMVIPSNNIGTLRRVGGVFSVSLTPLIIQTSKIETWTAKSYLSGDQVNYLGKDWVSNAATIAGDVPGTSSKWVERLNSYANPTLVVDNLVSDPYFSETTVGSTSLPVGLTLVSQTSVESLIVKSDSDYKGNALQITLNDINDQYWFECTTPVVLGYISLGFLIKQNIAKQLINAVYVYQLNSAGTQVGSTTTFTPSYIALNSWNFVQFGNVTLDPLCVSVKFGIRFRGNNLTVGDNAIATITGITASQSEKVLYAPKRNVQKEILREKALLSTQVYADLAITNSKVDAISEGPVTNDWYDPYFTKPYSGKYFSNPWCHFNFYNGGGAQGNNLIIPFQDTTNTFISCARVVSGGSFDEVGVSFSKEYLNQLNYANGETFRCGIYVRFPAASISNVKSVYVNKIGGSTPQEVFINNSNWNWVNFNDSVIVNNDPLQGYNFNLRYNTAGDIVFITGLILINTTKFTYPNKFVSSKVFNKSKITVKNQYIYEEYIDLETPLYNRSYEQNVKAFTKEIINLRTDNSSPVKSDGVKFTSSLGNNFTLNVAMTSLAYNSNRADGELFPINRDVKIKMGCWVKCEGNSSEVFSAIFNDNSIITNIQSHRYTNLEMNKWIWVESLAVNKLQADFKAFNNSYMMQLQHSPTTTCSFYVAGITYGYVDDNSLNFGYARYYDLDNIGRWYRKKFTSYGDSITAANQFQKNIMSKLSMKHYERGIGGSRVHHSQFSIAWVDVNGKLISQQPSNAPSGIEGVDYFTIDNSMCRQSRVNTIPTDSDYILIMAGANDGGHLIGTLQDAPSDVFDASFYASYKIMLDRIIARVPKATIVLLDITFVQNESTVMTGAFWRNEYRVAVRAIADLYGLPFIKLIDLGVNDKNWTSYSGDTVHPNAKFNKLIGDRIVKGLIEKTASVDEVKL